ncbi:MAG: GNAT family N-acetyltransferase [Chloroflexi bacterium]|nr:MAG: GNAT family N-acetyltransferase [Chloroflexota bacterium]
MPDVHIRPASSDDIDDIRAIGHTSWQSTYSGILPKDYIEETLKFWWSAEAIRTAMHTPENIMLVAEYDDMLVGMLSGSVLPDDEGAVVLHRVYVRPDYVGQGIGGQLWQAYLDQLDEAVTRIKTSVASHNTNAREFYQHIGFEEIGTQEVEEFGHHTMNTLLEMLVEREDD